MKTHVKTLAMSLVDINSLSAVRHFHELSTADGFSLNVALLVVTLLTCHYLGDWRGNSDVNVFITTTARHPFFGRNNLKNSQLLVYRLNMGDEYEPFPDQSGPH